MKVFSKREHVLGNTECMMNIKKWSMSQMFNEVFTIITEINKIDIVKDR